MNLKGNAIVCGTFHTDTFDRSLPSPEACAALESRLPLSRTAGPEEIIGTTSFLASDASAYMAGALLSVDGSAG